MYSDQKVHSIGYNSGHIDESKTAFIHLKIYGLCVAVCISKCCQLADNKSNQIKSNGLLGIAALMLDYNNIEVMCLQLITLRVVSVDKAVTKITSIYAKIQKHGFKTTENKF